MKYRCFWMATVLFYLSACYNGGGDELNYSDSKNIKEYYKIAKTEVAPVEAYKDAFTQLKIMHQNKTDIQTIGYDTCINKALSDKINYIKKTIELNVIDYGYLNYLVTDSVKSIDEVASWNFMHSKNFNSLRKLDDIDGDESFSSLAHLRKILDNRFTIIIHEEAKILPRTNKPNYVLGGFYEGYGLLYDLKNHQVLCYFNYRINNSSNYREDYTKDGKPIFENMMLELKSIHEAKLKEIVAEKLNLEPFQVNLGF